MFAMRWQCRTLLTMGSVVAVLWLAGGAAAQTPKDEGKDEGRDYLEQARRLIEVAAQKVESEVRAAGRDADRLSAANPGAAAERLKTALRLVEEDTALTEARRDNLARTLRTRIRALELVAAREAEKTPARQTLTTNRSREDRGSLDQDYLNQALDRIRVLRKDGRLEEARRLADDLGRRYPDNPVVQAMIRNTGNAYFATGAQTQRTASDRRLLSVSRGIDQSSTPPAGPIDYPTDWRERTKDRTGISPLTAKEKAILQALNSTLAVQFKGERFEDVIKYLSERIGQPILLDKVALSESLVNYDTQINFDTNGQRLSIRTILRKVLSESGNNLTYVIKDQTIEVTSTLNAQKLMVVRAYPIGDILHSSFVGGLTPLQLQAGPANQQALLTQQVQQIIDMIQSSVDPQSWHPNGGTITFHAPTMSLIIRQSAEVHNMLAGGIAR
jgi:hypothetical protein